MTCGSPRAVSRCCSLSGPKLSFSSMLRVAGDNGQAGNGTRERKGEQFGPSRIGLRIGRCARPWRNCSAASRREGPRAPEVFTQVGRLRYYGTGSSADTCGRRGRSVRASSPEHSKKVDACSSGALPTSGPPRSPTNSSTSGGASSCVWPAVRAAAAVASPLVAGCGTDTLAAGVAPCRRRRSPASNPKW